MSAIRFFSENIDFKPKNVRKLKTWVTDILTTNDFELLDLNFVFCDDVYLHKINLEYLAHDTYTDIVTFDNSEMPQAIEGDIFISVERVKENAKNLSVPFGQELQRVMIHGILHLMGYKDKTNSQKEVIRAKEDELIAYFSTI